MEMFDLNKKDIKLLIEAVEYYASSEANHSRLGYEDPRVKEFLRLFHYLKAALTND